MDFLIHVIVTAGLLMVVGSIVSGIDVENGKSAVFAALIVSIAKPVLFVLTFPITFLTMGLFLLVLNAFLLMVAAAFVDGFRVRGFKAAIIGSLLLSVLHMLVAWLF